MTATTSPPYAHLPTSTTTNSSPSTSSTTTTAHMPPVGTSRTYDDVTYVKDMSGWYIEGTQQPNRHYADAMTALRLDGWTISQGQHVGDICLGRIWLHPPQPATTTKE